MTTPASDPITATRPRLDGGDRLFRALTLGAAGSILAVLVGIGVFLATQGAPVLTARPGELTITGGSSVVSYIGALAFGTLLSSVIALAISAPLSVGTALFITHYAPRRLAAPLGFLVELLAAVPSVVYGLWGIFFLAPHAVGVYGWLVRHVGFLPFFAGPVSVTGRTMLTASLVLAVMILPVNTGLCREVFKQTPKAQEEAALALGATRWEMVRMAVLPPARGGMVSASLLGFGRALGETMAVAMVLSSAGVVTVNLVGAVNPGTVAANIALNFPESNGLDVNLLVATGLVLFFITFMVNAIGRAVVGTGKLGRGRPA